MHGTRMLIANSGPASGTGRLQEHLAECGAHVAHSFRLIPGVAAEMTPEALKRFLARFPEARVVPDRQRMLPPMPFNADDWAEIAGPGEKLPTSPSEPHTSPLAIDLMQVDEVHKLGIDGGGVRVCVIDSGVEFTHPDLMGTAILAGDGMPLAADFTETDLTDNMGHGTAVAGCIAAQARQIHTVRDDQSSDPVAFTRIKGIAPGVKIMSAKVFDRRVASGYDSTIIAALEWAAENGAQIINMSLGGVSLPNDGSDPLGAAVTALRERGILVVVSAGNEGSGIGTLKSPGSSPGALTVGASTMFRSFAELGFLVEGDKWSADQLAGFSSLGPSADGRPKPDILAPGAYDWGLAPTISTPDGQNVQLFGGTSQAAPFMAGVAALTYQAFHKIHGRYPTPDEATHLVCSTADDLGLPAHFQGAGRANALRAVQATLGTEHPLILSLPAPAVVLPGQTGTLRTTVTNPGTAKATLSPTITSFEKAKTLSEAFHGEIATAQSPQHIHFDVATGTDLLQVSLDWPSRRFTARSPRLLLAVYDPAGRFINYQSPAPSGENELGKSVDTWIAKPEPGRWSVRIMLRSGARDTVMPFTLSVRAFRKAPWPWVAANAAGLGSLAPGESRQIDLTVKVPDGTASGIYTGHLRIGEGAVPLAVVVPIPLEQGRGAFAGQFQHGYQGSWGNGDWLYHELPVPENTRSLIASLQWPDVDNAVEFYLINPAGHAVAGRSNSADILKDGSSFALGSQIVHADPEPGQWRLLLHSFAFCGRGMPEPYFGTVETGGLLISPRQVQLRINPGEQAPIALFVRNPGRMPLIVEAAAQSVEPELVSTEITGEIKTGVNAEGKAEGSGHIKLGTVEVPHGARQIGVNLTWDQPEAQVSVTLYDPVSRRTTAAGSDGLVMMLEPNPVPGEWSVIAGVTTPGVETRTVNLTGSLFVLAPSSLKQVEAKPVTVQPGGHAVLPLTVTVPEGEQRLAGRVLVTTTKGDRLGEIPFLVQVGEDQAEAEAAAGN